MNAKKFRNYIKFYIFEEQAFKCIYECMNFIFSTFSNYFQHSCNHFSKILLFPFRGSCNLAGLLWPTMKVCFGKKIEQENVDTKPLYYCYIKILNPIESLFTLLYQIDVVLMKLRIPHMGCELNVFKVLNDYHMKNV